MRKYIIAGVLCLSLVLGACSSGNSPKEEKTEQTTEKTEQVEETERDVDVKKKEYQPKLDVIEPSAYNNADGLALEKGAYISVIGKSEGKAFWNEVKKGAEQAAEDINKTLGYKGGDKVKVTYNGPLEAESVDEQVNILDEELARYPVAVAIAITDANACEVQFDLAAENNIPVVAFDSGSDYKGLMAMVSTDNEASASEAARHMAKAVGEEGEIVIFSHDSKSKTADVRERVFAETLKNEYPNMTVAGAYRLDEMKKSVSDEVNKGLYRLDDEEPSGTELAEEEKIKEEDVTRDNIIDYILKKHPNMKGCYATNGETAVLAVEGIKRRSVSGISVIGYDADEEEVRAVKEGEIAGLIVQNPYGMGYASVIAAARAALGMANEANIDTGYVWMTKDNIDSEEIERMLY